MVSVLQDWVQELPLREQGVLLTAVRGADPGPKEWGPDGEVVDTQARRLTGWIRWAFMVPHDPREVGKPGSFMLDSPPFPFKPSALGHLPVHFYSHSLHALEVIAYRHPDTDIHDTAYELYCQMVEALHLNPESIRAMGRRLSEDRIASGHKAI